MKQENTRPVGKRWSDMRAGTQIETHANIPPSKHACTIPNIHSLASARTRDPARSRAGITAPPPAESAPCFLLFVDLAGADGSPKFSSQLTTRTRATAVRKIAARNGPIGPRSKLTSRR